MAKGLSFKKEPRETGLASVSHPYPDTIIKLAGREVGRISGPRPTSLGGSPDWRIHIMIKHQPTEADPAPFKSLAFKATFASEPEARIWLQRHWPAICDKYQLYSHDD